MTEMDRYVEELRAALAARDAELATVKRERDVALAKAADDYMDWEKASDRAEQAEAELAALRQGIDEGLNITGYDDAARIKEVAQAQERKLKYCGELGKAEAQLAAVTARHQEWVAQNGACPPIVPGGVVKEMRALKAELAAVTSALRDARPYVVYIFDHEDGLQTIRDSGALLRRIDAALAAAPAQEEPR
jgi:hypothetical protein